MGCINSEGVVSVVQVEQRVLSMRSRKARRVHATLAWTARHGGVDACSRDRLVRSNLSGLLSVRVRFFAGLKEAGPVQG